MNKIALRAIVVILIAAAALIGGSLLRADEKPADVTFTGTVVDMHCYVTRGAHDAKHAACSNACIARGVPAGFLADDGVLYLLFGEKPLSVKDQVADLAEVPAILHGTLVVRSGVKGIQIKSIERKPASQ